MRSNRSMTWRKSIVEPIARGCAALVLAAILSGGRASAEPIAVLAEQALTPASSFSLDFGLYGGVSSAQITQTDFELEVDADQGTAKFTKYEQFVQSLILPGGFSTGNIRVEIVPGSSQGELNELTGEFDTTEQYAIHFDGDLSAFNLTSPVILPSASSGTLRLSALAGGNIIMAWTGIGQLPNPFDPANYIQFRYSCSVAAAFAPEPVTLLQLALMPKVVSLSLPIDVERSLMNRLGRSLTNVEDGHYRRASSNLDAFIQRVEAERGGSISIPDADLLLSDAEGAILLLGVNQTLGSREADTIPNKGGNPR